MHHIDVTLTGHARPLSTIALAIAVLMLTFALYAWDIDAQPVWHDEGWSIRAIEGPFTTPDDNTPHAYYLLGHLLWRLGGMESASPLAFYRLISALLGLLTIAMMYRVGSRWFGALAGLAAAGLAAFSPLLWTYAQEVRAYVLVPLIALLVLDLAGRLLADGNSRVPRHLWAYALVLELAGLYTHNLVVPLVAWLNAVVIAVWLANGRLQRLGVWIGVQLLVLLGYLPWLLTQTPSGTPLNNPPALDLTLIRDVWYAYWLPALPQLRDAGSVWWLDLLGVLALASSVVLIRFALAHRGRIRRTPASQPVLRVLVWLLLSQAFLLPVFSTALLLLAQIDFHPRYYIGSVPAALLLLVGAAYVLGRDRPHLYRPALTAIVGVTALAGAASVAEIRGTRAYQHDDFEALAAYYADLPSDAVILVPFGVEPALQYYYARAYDIQADFVNLPLHSDVETAADALHRLVREGPRHVEFLTWFQLPADPRGMYPCLLSAAASETLESRTFYGLSTQGYRLAEPIHFTPVAIESPFAEMTLDSLAYSDSPSGAVCVTSSWVLPGPVEENVKVSARLLSPTGDELARHDAPIARANNTGTSEWTAGDAGQAFNLLTLPDHAPPLRYTLALNLYTTTEPEGFDVLDEVGRPQGKIYLLENAIAGRGPVEADYEESALVADSADDGSVESGAELDVTVMAVGRGETVPVTLAGSDWEVEQVARASERGWLSWHEFVVPANYRGEAVLTVGEDEVARFEVVGVPRVFTPPEFEIAVGASFPGVGTLVGATVPDEVRAGEPFPVRLVFLAEGPRIRDSYTVFAQLISPDGVNLAQSDSEPAGGERPTTSWIEGEYVLDIPTLEWNVADYRGPASLIVGFYDPARDFQRLLTSDQHDYAVVHAEVQVR